jgi:outer membrane protein
MRRALGVLALLAAGWGAFGAAGELSAQAPDTLRLSLATALEIAEGNNPTYRQANNSALLNGVEMRTTWLDQILPRADLTLFNTAYTGNLSRIARDNFGNPIQNPGAEWVYFSSTTQSLDLSWNLQGLSLFQAHKKQALVNEDRDLSAVRALTGLQLQVQRLYMKALEQRELLRAEEELVEARRIDLDVAQRLFSLALRTRVDVLNAELAIEQQALALRQQRAAYEKALLSLRTQLGRDDVETIVLADEPLPIFDPSGLRAAALVSSALEVNPELRQSRVAVRSARLGLSEQKNAWWPQLAMGISVSRQAQTPQSKSLFDVTFNEDLDSRFYLQLSVPMFNGFFRNREATERASVDLDNRREAERDTRLRIEETVRSQLLELGNQWESLRLADRSLEIAGEALRLAREEYRLGTRSFEDLRSSFEKEAETRRQVISARHGFVDALLSLEEAVGVRVRASGAGSSLGAGGR